MNRRRVESASAELHVMPHFPASEFIRSVREMRLDYIADALLDVLQKSRIAMAIPTPQTIFTRDILGNFVCNTLAEATASGPFDVIIIGGGRSTSCAGPMPSTRPCPAQV